MDSVGSVAVLMLAAWLTAIGIVDARTYRIPDALSLPLIASGLAFSFWRSALPIVDHMIGAASGYLILALVGSAYFRLRGHEGLGLGDAKLFGAAGAWTGWAALPFILLVSSLLGLAYALGTRRMARSRIAFGPCLAAGFLIVWIFGTPFGRPVWR